MTYVDGFLLPLKKKNVKVYRSMAAKAGKLWIKHGALQFLENAGDDLDVKMGLSFAPAVKAKKDETVVFSFIVYKSRAHRDKVNAKVMADPAMPAMMKGPMPFDVSRMFYGGFKTIVEA
ncbi:MAG: DUF1428 domain-containing protein [Planctomycetota bacterium]